MLTRFVVHGLCTFSGRGRSRLVAFGLVASMAGEGEAPNRPYALLYERFDTSRQARAAEDVRLEACVAVLSPEVLGADLDVATTSGTPGASPAARRWRTS